MGSQSRQLVFAEKKFEQAYRRLRVSPALADRRLHLFITYALNNLTKNYSLGEKLPAEQIPKIYRDMFGVKNLWVIEIPPEWKVYYSLANQKLTVVDMTCDNDRSCPRLDEASGRPLRAE